MNKLIGVIGGLGPKATTYFMDLVIDNTIANCDQDNVDLVVCQFSSTPDRTNYIMGKSKENPIDTMKKATKILENSNVDYIVIPCNTASTFYEEIENSTTVKVINIIEETSNFVLDKNPKKIGLMATDGTIKSQAYYKFLKDKLFIPNEYYQNKIMSIIYDKVKKNKSVSKEEFLEIINYFKENNCDIIILGCTELSVLYKDLNLNIDYIVDSLTILARKTIKLAEKQLKEE